jgi:REP element-mobilizing transposase RayT
VWLYDGATTIDVGLTGPEHTRADGRKFSQLLHFTEAGQVIGYANRNDGGSTDLGRSAWLYNGATTINIGLTGPEHTRNDGYKVTSILPNSSIGWNEAGQVIGNSNRYNGSSFDRGRSTWLYNGTTTIPIGLTGPEYTRSDGYKYSGTLRLNEAGQVIGYSNRYGDGGGQSAWLYDGTTTIQIGLTGDEHTRNNGYRFSGVGSSSSTFGSLNEAGKVVGYSDRYNGGSTALGRSAWLYDGTTSVHIGLTGELGVRPRYSFFTEQTWRCGSREGQSKVMATVDGADMCSSLCRAAWPQAVSTPAAIALLTMSVQMYTNGSRPTWSSVLRVGDRHHWRPRASSMARPPRVEFPGAIYHVRARGNARQDIVSATQHWQRLEEDLALAVVRHGWELLTYVLMTNHLHLLLRTPLANLSRGMQYFLSRYANWYNRRQRRPGHLFQGRYKADLVEDESYYWRVSRYIHLNPRRTRPPLVAHPRDWRWSSYRGFDDPRHRVDWVAYDVLLPAWNGQYGGTDSAASYCRFVQSAVDEPLQSPFLNARDGWILGGEGFMDRIRRMVAGADRHDPDVPLRRRLLAVQVDEVLSAVASHYGVELDIFGSRGGGRPRAVAAWLSRRYTEASLRQLAGYLGLSHPGSVSNLMRQVDRDREKSAALRGDLAAIQQRLLPM